MKKMGTCCILSTEKLDAKSNNEAANIIGIAKKNENSVAVFRSSPDIRPPMIVDADPVSYTHLTLPTTPYV